VDIGSRNILMFSFTCSALSCVAQRGSNSARANRNNNLALVQRQREIARRFQRRWQSNP
jgi:hypothetical protein